MPGLEVTNLQVSNRFSGTFTVEPGQILAVVGPSGSGKTTLVEAIAGLVPASGSIAWQGKEISKCAPQNRPTALVAQTPVVFPALTVAENVGFALDNANMSEDIRVSRIDIALAEMRITGIADRQPHTLSGGQAQRTALARTLVQRPRILLLDEPLAHVDSHLRIDLQEVLINYTRELGAATIYVTHDVDEAFHVADRIAIIHHGSILQTSDPREVYERPSCRHVAHILGISNIFSCFVTSSSLGECRAQIGNVELSARGDVSRGEALLSFPAESIRFSDHGLIHGKVMRSVFVRSHLWHDIETSFGTVHASTPTTAHIHRGDHVHFDIDSPWIIPNDDCNPHNLSRRK
ncbi:ABC-type sugar transport system ATPase subunit [Trueperella bonasi]|uniref:ABC-type sugar transport system ATPase subunit n=1 Tax=Trueperella bonasi TaxID=312286 RepID=A0ABT9NES4_9ACTO|nr:ABC transporter ATP-binding protein [Trueperella bonasi]MDP9805844.1 ABC-type sugar transport system ATPase subunit [Trueperella bonasi]